MEDNDKIREAMLFSMTKHMNQKDSDGKDYFQSHILQVYGILNKVTNNQDILIAGLLHDCLEDTNATYKEIKDKFGERVAELVLEVTHDGNKDEIGYYFPHLKSKEGIIIKFADRLSNLSRIDNWSEERQEHYLKRSKFWKSERVKGGQNELADI